MDSKESDKSSKQTVPNVNHRLSVLCVRVSALRRYHFEGEFYVSSLKNLNEYFKSLKIQVMNAASQSCVGCPHCRYGLQTKQKACTKCFDPWKNEQDLRSFVHELLTFQDGFEIVVESLSFEPVQVMEDVPYVPL